MNKNEITQKIEDETAKTEKLIVAYTAQTSEVLCKVGGSDFGICAR